MSQAGLRALIKNTKKSSLARSILKVHSTLHRGQREIEQRERLDIPCHQQKRILRGILLKLLTKMDSIMTKSALSYFSAIIPLLLPHPLTIYVRPILWVWW